jgi:hypothetical protein
MSFVEPWTRTPFIGTTLRFTCPNKPGLEFTAGEDGAAGTEDRRSTISNGATRGLLFTRDVLDSNHRFADDTIAKGEKLDGIREGIFKPTCKAWNGLWWGVKDDSCQKTDGFKSLLSSF